MADAMPFLSTAQSVTVLVVDPAKRADQHGEESGADIALCLARHGVHVDVEQATSDGSPIGEVILSPRSRPGRGSDRHRRLQPCAVGRDHLRRRHANPADANARSSPGVAMTARRNPEEGIRRYFEENVLDEHLRLVANEISSRLNIKPETRHIPLRISGTESNDVANVGYS
jgi:hypothetical protein